MTEQKKTYLSESEMPRRWYNIQADMPNKMAPPLNPGTKKPIGPEDLAPIFLMELIKQEVSQERWIDILEPVIEKYMIYRTTLLVRA